MVSQSTRRLLVRLPSAFPLARVFRQLGYDARGAPRPVLRVSVSSSQKVFFSFRCRPHVGREESTTACSSSLSGPLPRLSVLAIFSL